MVRNPEQDADYVSLGAGKKTKPRFFADDRIMFIVWDGSLRVTIGHDTELGDFVTVNPAGIVSGEVVVGEGTLVGTPRLKPGIVVKVLVNPEQPTDRFNGKYMIVGASHRYKHSESGRGGGYTTSIRVRRDAEGG